jgi:hypothetical protein
VQLRLSIVEADERHMEEWRCPFPAEVDYELTFWANMAAGKRRQRAEKRC